MTIKNLFPIMAISMVIFSSCGPAGKLATREVTPSFPPFDQGGKTAIVAHRGFWNCSAAGFAQNSIASLREAQKHGFWGSECDIHLTSDNEVVVHHDRTIAGIDIQTCRFAELAPFRLRNGESIPTLDAYLAQAEESDKTVLIIELKPHDNAEREDKLVKLTLKAVKAHHLYSPDRVAFISFSKHICDVIAKECPEFTNQYLNGELSPAQLAADAINGLDYEDTVLLADPNMIAAAHALGMSTNVWTVNKREDLEFFSCLGIGAITTNEPLLLRDLLDNKEYRK